MLEVADRRERPRAPLETDLLLHAMEVGSARFRLAPRPPIYHWLGGKGMQPKAAIRR